MSECISQVQSFNFLIFFQPLDARTQSMSYRFKWDYIIFHPIQGVAALSILYIHNLVTLFYLVCSVLLKFNVDFLFISIYLSSYVFALLQQY